MLHAEADAKQYLIIIIFIDLRTIKTIKKPLIYLGMAHNVNTSGKQYLVYIDAEFQTYRVPDNDDPFLADGYIKTPHWTTSTNDLHNSNYHFMLSLGIIIYEGTKRLPFLLALFPSKAVSAEARFANPQFLEPAYTTVRPTAAAAVQMAKTQLVESDDRFVKHIFPWRNELNVEQQGFLDAGHRAYNKGLTLADRGDGLAILRYFLGEIVPRAKIVHKGQNDLYALMNTARLLELGVPPIDSRNLDMYLPVFKEVGWPGGLRALKEALVARNGTRGLEHLERRLIGDIQEFIVAKFGESARNSVGAHNPLVDCAYAHIVDIVCATLCIGAVRARACNLIA